MTVNIGKLDACTNFNVKYIETLCTCEQDLPVLEFPDKAEIMRIKREVSVVGCIWKKSEFRTMMI